MRIVKKVRQYITIVILLLSTFTFAQKRINLELVAKPGTAFVSGAWRIYSPNYLPTVLEKKITPSFDAGVKAVFNFKSKKGGKVIYDEMYQSGFYLADNISVALGLLYSFGGQNYKDLVLDDYTWSRKVRLQYLKVPFTFDFVKGKDSETQLVYTAGVYMSYLTWYKEATGTVYKTTRQSVVTKNKSMLVTSAGGTSKQYDLTDKPYQPFDYGFSLGVGMQKKILDDLIIRITVDGQVGFANVLNKSVQYNNGLNMVPYFEGSENVFLLHTNRYLGVMIGLKKTFEWTPAPKEERARWRIFRLKK